MKFRKPQSRGKPFVLTINLSLGSLTRAGSTGEDGKRKGKERIW